MARDPYKYFRVEARELLDQLSRTTLDLEKGTTSGLVAQLLRQAHTLKGAARVVRRTDIGDRAHAIEDVLAPLRDGAQQATRAQIDAILRHLDEIGGCVAALSSPEEAPSVQSPAQPSMQPPMQSVTQPPAQLTTPLPAAASGAGEVVRTARIDVGEMDTLLDGLAEMHAQLGALRSSLGQAHNARNLTDLLINHLAYRPERDSDARGVAAAGAAGGSGTLGRGRGLAEQAAASLDGFSRDFSAGIELIDRELKQVRDAAERMRLVPAHSLFVALERVARDAAQALNKAVTFEGSGGGVRLDAQVLDVVQVALSHAVRNAVAHGIEARGVREAAGKLPAGKVTLTVTQQGRWIVFTCRDDGGGVDFAAIRRLALQRGLIPAGVTPDPGILLQLLFKGGISTADRLTEVAGRGVGLDVVRDAADQLEGRAELRSDAGTGTTLILTVPLSVASLDGLQVEASGIVATIPIGAVRHTLRVEPSQLAHSAQGASLLYESRTLPFLPLAAALSRAAPAAGRNRAWSAVVVEAQGVAAAIGVDRLLGAANIVVRPLPPLAPAAAIVAGVSLDAEGNPQLVLDPVSLIQEAQRGAAERPQHEAVRPVILVIDDSLTTRMLERSILESAGYEVDLAVSGEEAMEKAGERRYALFLVDVEMPGMDGFTFIEQTRAKPELRDIPAILVTSRASPEDLQRGRDAGASGHIAKYEFDQGVLLTRISELVR